MGAAQWVKRVPKVREQCGVKGGHAEVYRVLSHVQAPDFGDLDLPLAGVRSLCCHTCWLGGSGARGSRRVYEADGIRVWDMLVWQTSLLQAGPGGVETERLV